MLKITRDLVDRQVVERTSIGRFFAEASDLELAPGEWPASIPTDLGNGMPFFVYQDTRAEDDCVLYRQELNTLFLLIRND